MNTKKTKKLKNYRKTYFLPLLIIGISFGLYSFTKSEDHHYNSVKEADSIEIPAEIQSIIDDKCYGCHNTESKGEKSKKKLNFDSFTNGKYSKGKTISKLGKIKDELDEDNMPPEKFLAKYPHKKLTPEEKTLMENWVIDQKKQLAGE